MIYSHSDPICVHLCHLWLLEFLFGLIAFAVELVGVPTAGYVWAPAQVPAFITRAGEASGNTTAAQSQPGYVGGNHWEVLMFAATTPGTGELVIEQRRPWESTEPASGTFRVTIVAHE